MARAVTIYGIKNCDTMKKARAWLDQRGVAYAFHDYKTQGIDRGRLEGWARDVGWETQGECENCSEHGFLNDSRGVG